MKHMKATRFLIESRACIFVKGYEILPSAKSIGINISKSVIKNLWSKYSQKLLDHGNQSGRDAFKIASKI